MKRAADERVQQLIDRMPEEFLEAWEERAAIREYDVRRKPVTLEGGWLHGHS